MLWIRINIIPQFSLLPLASFATPKKGVEWLIMAFQTYFSVCAAGMEMEMEIPFWLLSQSTVAAKNKWQEGMWNELARFSWHLKATEKSWKCFLARAVNISAWISVNFAFCGRSKNVERKIYELKLEVIKFQWITFHSPLKGENLQRTKTSDCSVPSDLTVHLSCVPLWLIIAEAINRLIECVRMISVALSR